MCGNVTKNFVVFSQHRVLLLCQNKLTNLKLRDGWMTCDFTSFSTVFQSYQDNRQMIMKICVQWIPVELGRVRLERGTNPGPLDQ